MGAANQRTRKMQKFTAMPTSRARILSALIISASILMLIVSAQEQLDDQPQRKPGRKLSQMGREFLIAHNKVRLHTGEPPLKWDRDLARYTRRYASIRAADCKMVHSYGPYGENIFWGGHDHWTPTEVVRSWVREHRFYQKETNACEPGEMCGHYTQVVWRATARLGCASVKCNNGGLFALCAYDPPGNYVDESPFENPSTRLPDTAISSPEPP